MKINDVLIRPILTEKATNWASNKEYAFQVNVKANKFQIKETVETIYSVKVERVRIINRKGKKRKIGKKMIMKELPDKKIAIVKVSEGKIGLFPQA